MLTKFGSQIPE